MASFEQPDFFEKQPERLNVTKVAAIKRLLLQGVFQHRIAAEFGVNQGRISEINTGKTWQHVCPA